MKNIRMNMFKSAASAAGAGVFALVLVFGVAPAVLFGTASSFGAGVAHAQYYDYGDSGSYYDYGDSSGCCSGSWDTTSGYDYYTPSTSWDTTSGYDYYTPSTYWDTTSGYDYYTPSTYTYSGTSGGSTYYPATYSYSSTPATTYTATGGGVYSTGGGYIATIPYHYGGGSYGTGGVTYNNNNSSYTDNSYYNYQNTQTYNYGGGYNYYPVYPSYPTYPVYNQSYCTLSASPTSAAPGQPVTLYWSSPGASYGSITGVGSVSSSGSASVTPYQTTTYTATFTGPAGYSATCSTVVGVAAYNYNPTPYVTLSQVPYTGLDLGPVGTALYWLFLVLWCAIAAYFIAVKKVHNRFLMKFRTTLFGDASVASHPAYAHGAGAHSNSHAAHLSHTVSEEVHKAVDAIDEFILKQVNRSK